MGRLFPNNTSFYFALYVINMKYPDTNTVLLIENKRDRHILHVDNKQGTNLPYGKLKHIEDNDMRQQAYMIDFVMRLVGQGGSNITLYEGCYYTNWTTFYNDVETEISKVSYDPIIMLMIFSNLGEINTLLFDIQDQYGIDLKILSNTLVSIWTF